jgi:hypothetical protein
MTTRLYTVLGFAAWQGIKLLVRRKVGQNRATLAAVATVALVVLGGLAAAKATNGDDA